MQQVHAILLFKIFSNMYLYLYNKNTVYTAIYKLSMRVGIIALIFAIANLFPHFLDTMLISKRSHIIFTPPIRLFRSYK